MGKSTPSSRENEPCQASLAKAMRKLGIESHNWVPTLFKIHQDMWELPKSRKNEWRGVDNDLKRNAVFLNLGHLWAVRLFFQGKKKERKTQQRAPCGYKNHIAMLWGPIKLLAIGPKPRIH